MRLRVKILLLLQTRCRRSSDPVWLWLRCRPAAAAPIRPLAWAPPCAMGTALKKKRKKEKKGNVYIYVRLGHFLIQQKLAQ